MRHHENKVQWKPVCLFHEIDCISFFRADPGFQIKRRQAPVTEQRPKLKDDDDDDTDDDDDIGDKIVDFFNNSNRKQAGLGLVARILGTSGPKPDKNWVPRLVFTQLSWN